MKNREKLNRLKNVKSWIDYRSQTKIVLLTNIDRPCNLDPSYKMDLDIWDYLEQTSLELWDCFRRETPCNSRISQDCIEFGRVNPIL